MSKNNQKKSLGITNKLARNNLTYKDSKEVDLWQRLQETIHRISKKSSITCKIRVMHTAAIEVIAKSEMAMIHILWWFGFMSV